MLEKEQRILILSYDLQFFAKDGPGGEKTEEPTSKKLDDARKEGQVAKSKEIANAFGLLALFLVLKLYVGTMGESFIEVFRGIYGQIPKLIQMYDGMVPTAALMVLIKSVMLRMLLILAPVLLVSLVVAFVCDVVQVKWRVTTKPLKPKFSKMNPIKGFGRIFSPNSLVELLKSVAKIGIVAYVVYSYLKDRLEDVYLLYD